MPALHPAPRRSGFDKLARPYRWMEYLSFGPLLERCRFRWIPELSGCRRALVLGDGDGRFTARLLSADRSLHVDAVDVSAGMLAALRERCERAGVQNRLTTHHASATGPLPAGEFDLIATHFFLDCLSDEDTVALARRIREQASQGALWVVSDFVVAEHGGMRLLSRWVVRALYFCFRVLTGLRTRSLPDWPGALAFAGFRPVRTERLAGGLLTSQLWQAEVKSGRQR